MEITLVQERAMILQEQLSMDQAEGRAWSHKMEAFGRLERVTSLFSRPKDEDFELLYKEKRYQPFWHIICTARYVYERRRQYPLKVSGPEIKSVTIEGTTYDATLARRGSQPSRGGHEEREAREDQAGARTGSQQIAAAGEAGSHEGGSEHRPARQEEV